LGNKGSVHLVEEIRETKASALHHEFAEVEKKGEKRKRLHTGIGN